MPLIAPWSRIACALCGHRLHLAQARNRCAEGPVEPDVRLARYLDGGTGQLTVELTKVVDRRASAIDWLYTPRRTADGSRLVCPECNFPIPHMVATGGGRSHTIAIVGVRSAGKSNYLATLIHELRERYAGEVGFSIQGLETLAPTGNEEGGGLGRVSSEAAYRARYGDRLYRQRRLIEPTPLAAVRALHRTPLIYRVTFPARRWHGLTVRRARSVELIFQDAAGEELNSPGGLDRFLGYIANASAVVVCVDPLSLSSLNAHLGDNTTASTTRPEEIVTRMLELCERRGIVAAGRRLPIPAAIAVTKSDLLDGRADLVDPRAAMLRDCRHTRGLNGAEVRRVGRETKALLATHGGEHLINQAALAFRETEYFAVSALGGAPEHDHTVRELRPRRVGDPLLWAFNRLRLLPKISETHR